MYLSYCEKNIGTHLHSNKLARCVFFNYWSKNTHILKEYKEKLSLFDDINDCYDIKWDPIYDREPDDWDCFFLSLNPNITWDIVQSNPNKSWNYAMLSKNPNITWNNGVNLVQSNPHPVPERTALAGGTSSLDGPACGNGKDWDYNMLSKNPNITWDIVKENPDRAWDNNILLSNINFFNNSYVEKLIKIIYHFKTNITEELMIHVWHPSRVEKWKYLLDEEEIFL